MNNLQNSVRSIRENRTTKNKGAKVNILEQKTIGNSTNIESNTIPIIDIDTIKHFPLYDSNFPPNEQFPRNAVFKFEELNKSTKISIIVDGNELDYGATLTDNSVTDDGYRFHDVFHLTYMAVLGWSPTVRAILKLKRKSNSVVDEVEDGLRAVFCEEGHICHFWGLAKKNNYFTNNKRLINLIKNSISALDHLEVSSIPIKMWEKAILRGFEVWKEVFKNKGGYVKVDLNNRNIYYLGNLTN